MRDKLTADERQALGLWTDRAAIETRAAWHLGELVAELRAVARSKGREIEIPDPFFFRDLLETLVDLEVSPAEFFAGVMRRWYGSCYGSN